MNSESWGDPRASIPLHLPILHATSSRILIGWRRTHGILPDSHWCVLNKDQVVFLQKKSHRPSCSHSHSEWPFTKH